jgi:hypothetical protein
VSFEAEPVRKLVLTEDGYFGARYHSILCHHYERIVGSFKAMDGRQPTDRIVTFCGIKDKFKETFLLENY